MQDCTKTVNCSTVNRVWTQESCQKSVKYDSRGECSPERFVVTSAISYSESSGFSVSFSVSGRRQERLWDNSQEGVINSPARLVRGVWPS